MVRCCGASRFHIGIRDRVRVPNSHAMCMSAGVLKILRGAEDPLETTSVGVPSSIVGIIRITRVVEPEHLVILVGT